MSTVDKKLKYLFTAEYEDGSTYVQPEDDISRLHKGTEDFTPSSFRDVKQDELVAFSLSDGKDTYKVDLRTGDFSVNGKEISLHEQNFDPYCNDLKLIYFREVRKEFNSGTGEVAHYINKYFMGWQCTDKDGKNHQLTIGVK